MTTDIVAPHPYGPAMLSLNDRQRKFVHAYMEEGGIISRITDCYIAAGYECKDREVTRVAASRLLHRPEMVAAIKEEADLRLRSGAILGASVLIDIASNPKHKNQFKAAIELLNRSDLIVATKHEVTVDDKRIDKAALIDRARMLAEQIGMDPNKLLAPFVDVIDGEFVEVEPAVDEDGEEW